MEDNFGSDDIMEQSNDDIITSNNDNNNTLSSTPPATTGLQDATIAKLQQNIADNIAQRAAMEAEKEKEMRKKAEEELDNFYDRRTDALAARQSANREAEQVFLEHIAATEKSPNPWEKVVDLVDIKAQADEKDFEAKSRMRTLLIQRKADFQDKEKQ